MSRNQIPPLLLINDQGANFTSPELDLLLKEPRDLLHIPMGNPITVIIDSADTEFKSEILPPLTWLEQKQFLKLRQQQFCKSDDYQSMLLVLPVPSKEGRVERLNSTSLTTATLKKNASLFRWIEQLRHLNLNIDFITFSAFFDHPKTGITAQSYVETPSPKNLIRHTLHHQGAVIMSRFSRNTPEDIEKMYQENIAYAERTFGLNSSFIKRYKNNENFYKTPSFSQHLSYLKSNTISQNNNAKNNFTAAFKKSVHSYLKKLPTLNSLYIRRFFQLSALIIMSLFLHGGYLLFQSHSVLSNLENKYNALQYELSPNKTVDLDLLAFRAKYKDMPFKVFEKLPHTENLKNITWQQQDFNAENILSISIKKTKKTDVRMEKSKIEKNLGVIFRAIPSYDNVACFSCKLPSEHSLKNTPKKVDSYS